MINIYNLSMKSDGTNSWSLKQIWLIMTLWTQTLFKYNITNIVN